MKKLLLLLLLFPMVAFSQGAGTTVGDLGCNNCVVVGNKTIDLGNEDTFELYAHVGAANGYTTMRVASGAAFIDYSPPAGRHAIILGDRHTTKVDGLFGQGAMLYEDVGGRVSQVSAATNPVHCNNDTGSEAWFNDNAFEPHTDLHCGLSVPSGKFISMQNHSTTSNSAHYVIVKEFDN